MRNLLLQCRNLGRIIYLETLWGFRIPESLVYTFIAPSLILLLLGLVRDTKEYLHFLVPGLIAISIASGAMQGIGARMSFMRIYGSWRTLQASPIPASTYFVGLLGSRLLRIYFVVAIMLLVAIIFLGYQLQDNLALMFFYVLVGTSVFSALGLVISAIVSSPQAVSGVINLVTICMLFTSDVLYVSNVRWVKTLSLVFPLTFLADLLRDNAVGHGFERDSLLNLSALAAWLVVASCVAIQLAKRRVEEK